jgi:hypothetical protein
VITGICHAYENCRELIKIIKRLKITGKDNPEILKKFARYAVYT